MMLVTLMWLLVACSVRKAGGVIVASRDNIQVDCGTDPGGPVQIVFDSGTPTPNVVKLLSPGNLATCAVPRAEAVGGVYTLSDVRGLCNVIQPDPTKDEYLLQIILQEIEGIVQATDPVFNIQCSYSTDQVTASSSITTTRSSPGTSLVVQAIGTPDMTYTLQVLTPQQQPVTNALLGEQIVLQIAMSGTDADEVSLQVESCVAKSGDANVTFLENGCMAAGKQSLSALPGFMTTATNTFLPLTVFAVEGSTSTDVQYECVINVCNAACDGSNCAIGGRRRRRAADDDVTPGEDKSLTLARTIHVVPVDLGIKNGQSNQNESVSNTCMQSLGFIVTVTVLAILLLIAMVAVIFMFTARRRDLEGKQTP